MKKLLYYVLSVCVDANSVRWLTCVGLSGAGGAIPGGATLNFDVEVVDITEVRHFARARFQNEIYPGSRTNSHPWRAAGSSAAPPQQGPIEPNLFADLDVSPTDGVLSKEEVLAFFTKQGKDELPDGLWENEDKDGDGFISWEEFGGPKGTKSPKEEL